MPVLSIELASKNKHVKKNTVEKRRNLPCFQQGQSKNGERLSKIGAFGRICSISQPE
jgi:hypothetical protein